MSSEWTKQIVKGAQRVIGDSIRERYDTTAGSVLIAAPQGEVDVYAFQDECPPHDLKITPRREKGNESYDLHFYKSGRTYSKSTIHWNLLLAGSLIVNAVSFSSYFGGNSQS